MFINRSSLLADNSLQFYYGIAVVDVDGDGEFEFFVTGFNGFPNLVLKWTGRAFRNIAKPILADIGRNAIGVASCDIDGDGEEEIYILNTDTFAGQKRVGDRLFDRMDGEWTDLFSLPTNQALLNLTAGRSVACLDRDGDGYYGFFVANYGGPMRLYELDEDGRLIDAARQAKVDLVTGGRSLVALPLVSDRMDVFAGNELGYNFLFRNCGDGTFEEVAAQRGVDDPLENARGVSVLDANGDGRFDLVCGNWEGPHRLFVQQTDGTFRDAAPIAMAHPSRVRSVIAADFDNDGYEEIFFNNIGQQNRLFGQRNGLWAALNVGDALEPYELGTGAAIGDLDGDGRLELLIAHGEATAQRLSLYHTPANGNGWLRVMPLTPYGSPARGAVVRLYTPERVHARAIDAGSGYLCQMEPIAHFGLGANPSTVTRIEVYWPDGKRAVVQNPQINSFIRVPYPR